MLPDPGGRWRLAWSIRTKVRQAWKDRQLYEHANRGDPSPVAFVGAITEGEVGKPEVPLAVALRDLTADAEAVQRHVRSLVRRLKRPRLPAIERGQRRKGLFPWI